MRKLASEPAAAAGCQAGARYCTPRAPAPLPSAAGCTISAERRAQVYRLCQQYGLLIVEDDPYCYLRYGGGPGGCCAARWHASIPALLLRKLTMQWLWEVGGRGVVTLLLAHTGPRRAGESSPASAAAHSLARSQLRPAPAPAPSPPWQTRCPAWPAWRARGPTWGWMWTGA